MFGFLFIIIMIMLRFKIADIFRIQKRFKSTAGTLYKYWQTYKNYSPILLHYVATLKHIKFVKFKSLLSLTISFWEDLQSRIAFRCMLLTIHYRITQCSMVIAEPKFYYISLLT